MLIKKFIEVKMQRVGFHYWKNAPADVDFLRHQHRHNFHIKIKIQVFKYDRELEFYTVKRELKNSLSDIFDLNCDFSCEMFAEKILELCIIKYGKHREYVIEVSEDNENSGIVEYKFLKEDGNA